MPLPKRNENPSLEIEYSIMFGHNAEMDRQADGFKADYDFDFNDGDPLEKLFGDRQDQLQKNGGGF